MKLRFHAIPYPDHLHDLGVQRAGSDANGSSGERAGGQSATGIAQGDAGDVVYSEHSVRALLCCGGEGLLRRGRD